MAQKRSNFSLLFPLRKRLGGGLLAVGVVLLVLLVLVLPVWTRLDCDRSVTQRISCRLRGANLIGITWRHQKISPLVGAETNLQSSQGGYRYRTSIFTYDDEIPLASFSVAKRQASRAKGKIMDFVKNKTAQQLRISYRAPWVLFAVALAFAVTLSVLGAFLLWL